MAIIKEKTVKISSVIENLAPSGLCESDAEKSESVSEGFLKISEDGYHITAAENTEGGKLLTDIVIACGSVRVKRSGAIESEMLFEEGLLHKSLYSVPPYSFDAEIVTKRIRNSMTADGGHIDIFYDMKIGGAEKRVKMRIECI